MNKNPRIVQNAAIGITTSGPTKWHYTKGADGMMSVTVYVRNKKQVFEAINISISSNGIQLHGLVTVKHTCGEVHVIELAYDR